MTGNCCKTSTTSTARTNSTSGSYYRVDVPRRVCDRGEYFDVEVIPNDNIHGIALFMDSYFDRTNYFRIHDFEQYARLVGIANRSNVHPYTGEILYARYISVPKTDHLEDWMANENDDYANEYSSSQERGLKAWGAIRKPSLFKPGERGELTNEVAHFIIDEIGRNVSSAVWRGIENEIRNTYLQLGDYTIVIPPTLKDLIYDTHTKLYDLLQEGRPWDYKWRINCIGDQRKQIRATLAHEYPELSFEILEHGTWHRIGSHYYFYDIWSNIHFGYVVRPILKYDRWIEFLGGVGQFFSTFSIEGSDDVLATQIGMQLYDDVYSGRSTLRAEDLINKIKSANFSSDVKKTRSCYLKTAFGVSPEVRKSGKVIVTVDNTVGEFPRGEFRRFSSMFIDSFEVKEDVELNYYVEPQR